MSTQTFLCEFAKDIKDFRLKTLEELSDSRCLPFTKDHQEIFLRSSQIFHRAEKLLSWRGYVGVSIVGTLSGLSAIPLASYASDDESTWLSVFTASLISSITTTSLAVFGLYVAGAFNNASNKGNHEQNVLNALRRRYLDAATHLIGLFTSPKPVERTLAIRLAEKIDIGRIQKCLEQSSIQVIDFNDFLGPLQESIEFIKEVKDPTNICKIPFTFQHSLIEDKITLYKSLLAIESNSNLTTLFQ